jgi:Arc/MetJ family transcription regulator
MLASNIADNRRLEMSVAPTGIEADAEFVARVAAEARKLNNRDAWRLIQRRLVERKVGKRFVKFQTAIWNRRAGIKVTAGG